MVKIDLPGVSPENLDISVEGDALTISGQRGPDGPKDEGGLAMSGAGLI